uniref:MCF.2 cell line derived transforming sequence a n=1 Tax=Cyprinus carpio TaxID=7962 RepID=A0A8C1T2X7_CYPCA
MWLIFIVSSEVTVPVSMQEVAGYIEKQVAYLSGGRGEDSSVIITLPECSAFSDIPEEALAKVLSYLTLIPRSVSNTSASPSHCIAASFPGNLHLVLVLRPTSFFQRTVTDLGFRFSQEDFMLKMPVVMLSSVTDLLRYIDENQLTSEFGGTLDYCHSDWIVLRTAIESFAVMVKDIAQMLQAFGTELAETQLSEECSAVEFLLLSHTEKYRRLKVQLNEALMCRESSHFFLIDYWLLAQLTDMEMAFDGFFDKHHLKLQQYLQLLRYEHSFQEVNCFSVPKIARKHTDGSQTNSVANMLIFLIDLCLFQDEMSQAQVLILHGHQLAAGHHYAMALIVQRCNELRHQCDTLTSALNTKRNSLTQAQTLLRLLEEAQRWCDDGAYLLANQQVDKFQSKEGAQAALRDIEKFQEAAPPLLEVLYCGVFQAHIEKTFQKHSSVQALIQSRQNCLRKLADKHVRPIQLVVPRPENPPRAKSPLFSPKHGMWWCNINFGSNYPLFFSHEFSQHVMKELIETERIYVEELLAVLLGYRAEMDNPSLAPLLPTSLRNKRDVLFGNLPDIYNFHSSVFLQDLESCLESPEAVGACFLERKEHFHLYECYCQNKPRSDSLWRQFSDCPFFQECQKKLEHKLALDSYLLKPVQRLTKYQLLLKELLKYSSGCERASELQGALEAMLDLLKSVNDSMHQIAITGYEGDLSNLGRVLMQGSFSVWISHKKGPTRVKELARFKPMQRHLFLHEHALLFCKRREEHGENADKTPSYSFKHCLKMSAVGITENVKGDVKKFEIWYSGREEVYLIQAPTVEVKIAWLNEIRKILTNQQKQLKGLNTFPRSCVTLLQSQSRCRCLLLSQ